MRALRPASDRTGPTLLPIGRANTIFYELDNQDQPKIVASRLWGVPFWQTFPSSGKPHTLTCHAMSGVYGALIDLIAGEWPKEVAA
jgi:hypothetical protein